jgi:predicted nucleotidyltransferase
MDKTTLSAYLEEILNDIPEISLVYLFGSQVQGNTGPLSDVDLGILIDSAAEGLEILARLEHLLLKAYPGTRFDLVPLRQASIELAYQVIAHGQCLFEESSFTRVEFEADVMSRHGDYLPVIRKHYQDILRGDEDDRRVQRYRATLRRTERTLDQIKTPHK